MAESLPEYLTCEWRDNVLNYEEQLNEVCAIKLVLSTKKQNNPKKNKFLRFQL
jgi:hypothetical protein